jgi:hypothetical protein
VAGVIIATIGLFSMGTILGPMLGLIAAACGVFARSNGERSATGVFIYGLFVALLGFMVMPTPF